MYDQAAAPDASPMRVWKLPERPWKKLKRWASLPSWQLAPQNRQLFKCPTCAFTNTYGEICLQCSRRGCVPQVSHTLKRRRVSAPQLLNDLQKEQLHKIQRRHTLYKPSGQQASTGLDLLSVCPPETKTVRRRRHRDAAVFSIHDVAAAACLSPEANFYVQSIILTRDEEASPPASPVLSDVPEGSVAEKELFQTLPVTPGSPRTLRRKKRFSLTRQRSSSLRNRSSLRHSTFSAHELALPSPLHTPVTRPHLSSAMFTPPPTLEHKFGTVPLGHPSRPLYTAIRRNLFMPSTPSGNDSPLRHSLTASTPEPISHLRARSLDLQPSFDFSEGGNFASVYFHRPYAVDLSSGAGCSLSGETELRMELARRNTIGGSAAHPEYKFEYRDAKQSSGGGMKLTVKKIGQGLRNLVMLRRPSTPANL
ncbi:hypothetical protein BDW22DRAFT_1429065 [Trametopsis cervina]|nr:hypothetical protein BDW22DRAFT_1429065 [Trametopsis cervina]